ncbi:MAG: hypothetical protein HS128_23970 [Ideonella sp.]|nr:hypothetical protein [Ideonella sp.]MCC7459565.1 hypothetical protein [Nitrospira sp.]
MIRFKFRPTRRLRTGAAAIVGTTPPRGEDAVGFAAAGPETSISIAPRPLPSDPAHANDLFNRAAQPAFE